LAALKGRMGRSAEAERLQAGVATFEKTFGPDHLISRMCWRTGPSYQTSRHAEAPRGLQRSWPSREGVAQRTTLSRDSRTGLHRGNVRVGQNLTDGPEGEFRFTPKKRLKSDSRMYELCHKQKIAKLFDHPVGTAEQRERNYKPRELQFSCGWQVLSSCDSVQGKFPAFSP